MSPTRQTSSGKPASTGSAITQAAGEIFLKEGFEAASMDAIARHADVSKATLYARFSSKDVLFSAVMKAQREDFERELDDLTAEPDGDTAERLTRAGKNLLTFFLSPPRLQMFRVIIAESERIPEICQNFLHTSREHARQQIAGIFRDGIESGQLIAHDADESARLFMSALRGDLVWSSLMGGPERHPGNDEIALRVAAVVKPLTLLYRTGRLDKPTT